MGGSKPTFVPFPTFISTSPANGQALITVGRCRINPLSCSSQYQDEFVSIYEKNVEQSNIPDDDQQGTDPEMIAINKKLKKKYMKQGVAMAEMFLSDTLKVDASIINVEIFMEASMIIQTDGCIAACFLDAGCDKIVVTGKNIHEVVQAMAVARVPKERVVAQIDHISDLDEVSTPLGQLTDSISVTVQDDTDRDSCIELIQKISEITNNSMAITLQLPGMIVDKDETLVSFLTTYFGEKNSPHGTVSLVDPTADQLGSAYVSCIRTDRPDSLFTTVVCTRSGEALGLVYSSRESIIAAIECGRGVYYSRSRNGLWRKGDTSGHYQTLHRIDVDCDGDALRFTVTQRGEDCVAFCHLNTLSCWGEPHGLRHLEGTLRDRLKNAPAGSYTKRLFDDDVLLRDKLVEEAQELSEADTRQHVAEELADVLYFAMVKAVKAGVSIDDAVRELDKRTRKVTRRQGDSKAFRIKAGDEILNKHNS